MYTVQLVDPLLRSYACIVLSLFALQKSIFIYDSIGQFITDCTLFKILKLRIQYVDFQFHWSMAADGIIIVYMEDDEIAEKTQQFEVAQYCKICNVYVNSWKMLEMHNEGEEHLKNLNKI